MLSDTIQMLEGSTLDNLTIASGTSFPSNASVGEMFFRTDLQKLHIHNGTVWNAIAEGANAATQSLFGNFTGITSNTVGTARYYPKANSTMTLISAWAGAAVPSTTVVTVKKNGVAVGTCTIASAAIIGTPTVLSVSVTTSDYLTLDLTSTGAISVTTRIDF